jgi:hypothetical protein
MNNAKAEMSSLSFYAFVTSVPHLLLFLQARYIELRMYDLSKSAMEEVQFQE